MYFREVRVRKEGLRASSLCNSKPIPIYMNALSGTMGESHSHVNWQGCIYSKSFRAVKFNRYASNELPTIVFNLILLSGMTNKHRPSYSPSRIDALRVGLREVTSHILIPSFKNTCRGVLISRSHILEYIYNRNSITQDVPKVLSFPLPRSSIGIESIHCRYLE